MKKIETTFNVPIFNYLEHDFHQLKEIKSKKEKSEVEYLKLSNKRTVSEVSTINSTGKELERVKTEIEQENISFGEVKEALNNKRTTKFSKILKETIHSQAEFYFLANKTMIELDPYIENLNKSVNKPKEEEEKLYKEGFLRKLKSTTNKPSGNTFRRIWVVLKPGYLYTYKGKEATVKSRSINLLISTVKSCGNKIDPKNKANLFLFEVISPGIKKLVLGCKSDDERNNWIKAISDIISNSLDQQVLTPEINEKKVKSDYESDESVLIKLRNIPGNKFCADCDSKGKNIFILF